MPDLSSLVRLLSLSSLSYVLDGSVLQYNKLTNYSSTGVKVLQFHVLAYTLSLHL